MARPSTGQVLERKRGRDIAYAIRFRAYGQRRYLTLGRRSEGWTRRAAETELANVLADVRRGIWQPPAPDPEPDAPRVEPTFHEFASDWYERRKREGLRDRTLGYLEWALTVHLLPAFARMRLSQITVEEVDRYVARKASEGRLSNATVNKTVGVLASVLELAAEYGHIERNPAKGRRRRLPVEKPARLFLEPPQVVALLAAAGELDAEDRRDRRLRRPLLATAAYAGLRVGELLALTWRDVDLAGGHVDGRIHVRRSKTEAGVREVDVQPELLDELLEWKAATRYGAPGDLVFPTASGRPGDRNHVRRRTLAQAIERANARIDREGGCDPLPPALSPHGLRRSFASWLVAEGEDPAYVMQQLGHVDPKMTLGLYARALKSKRRRPLAQRARGGEDWAAMGTNAPNAMLEEAAAPTA